MLFQQLELFLRALYPHQIIQYLPGPGASFQVPANVFARHPHAVDRSVETVQALQVLAHDGMNFFILRRW